MSWTSVLADPGVTIGSLTGPEGLVLLGANTLTIGTNNQSTAFSGMIQDSGGLVQTGAGTLTLTGANTYTGNTTVSAGMLAVSNGDGSATGTGSVNVQAGALGGKGIISGAVAIGTGSGNGALLAPAARTNVQATLTIQSALTFNADAIYNCSFRAKRNRADRRGVCQWDYDQQRRDDCLEGSDPGATHYRLNSDSDQ